MQKNLTIEKITFKVDQIKFLTMHITNQKLSFDIFTVGNLLNIFMEHDLYLKGWLTFFFLGLIVFMGCSLACVHACFF